MDLGIVIVSYNVCDLLRRCLHSVFASDPAVQFEVCVVDNHSADDSASMVRSEFPQVHLIENAENLGYPAANNQGLRYFGLGERPARARPRYCLLLNPDTEVPTDAFGRSVGYLEEQPQIGVLGPKVLLPDGRLDVACRRSFPTPEVSFYRMVGLSRLFPSSRRFARYNMTYLDEDQIAEVDSVVGAFMMVRSAALSGVGLMDERFFMYGEDLDWAKRIKDAGWKVVYYPEVSILHIKRASSKGSARAQLEFYRAMLIFYYKHYRGQTPFLVHWLVLAGISMAGGSSIWKDVRLGPAILEPGA
jgi:GT2 family glycosyltransferase